MKTLAGLFLTLCLMLTYSSGRAEAPTVEQTLHEIKTLVEQAGTTTERSGATGSVRSVFVVTDASLSRVQVREERAVSLWPGDTPSVFLREYEFAPKDIAKVETRKRDGGKGTIWVLELRAKSESIAVKQTLPNGNSGTEMQSSLFFRLGDASAQKALKKAFQSLAKAAS